MFGVQLHLAFRLPKPQKKNADEEGNDETADKGVAEGSRHGDRKIGTAQGLLILNTFYTMLSAVFFATVLLTILACVWWACLDEVDFT